MGMKTKINNKWYLPNRMVSGISGIYLKIFVSCFSTLRNNSHNHNKWVHYDNLNMLQKIHLYMINHYVIVWRNVLLCILNWLGNYSDVSHTIQFRMAITASHIVQEPSVIIDVSFVKFRLHNDTKRQTWFDFFDKEVKVLM